MRNYRQATSWVVYRTSFQGTAGSRTGVCDQTEWEAMEVAKPGVQTLIRGGIASESEAEQMARTAGYDTNKSKRW
jgi:hypothetical protein